MQGFFTPNIKRVVGNKVSLKAVLVENLCVDSLVLPLQVLKCSKESFDHLCEPWKGALSVNVLTRYTTICYMMMSVEQHIAAVQQSYYNYPENVFSLHNLAFRYSHLSFSKAHRVAIWLAAGIHKPLKPQ